MKVILLFTAVLMASVVHGYKESNEFKLFLQADDTCTASGLSCMEADDCCSGCCPMGSEAGICANYQICDQCIPAGAVYGCT